MTNSPVFILILLFKMIQTSPTNITWTATTPETIIENSVPCTGSNLVILLDKSASINPYVYLESKQFAAHVAQEWKKNDNSNVAVLVFGTRVGRLLDFKDNYTPDQVRDHILNNNFHGYLAPGSNTQLAIRHATHQLTENTVPNRANIVLVITDGESSEPQATLDAVQQMRDKEIKAVVVGVGNHPTPELYAIAEDQHNLFMHDSQERFANLLLPVMDRICKIAKI